VFISKIVVLPFTLKKSCINIYLCYVCSADVIPGMMRWQMKLWKNVGRLIEARKQPPSECDDFDTEFNLSVQTNKTIEQVNFFSESYFL